MLAAVSDGGFDINTETICDGVKVVALIPALTGTPEAGYSLVTLDVAPEAGRPRSSPARTLTALHASRPTMLSKGPASARARGLPRRAQAAHPTTRPSRRASTPSSETTPRRPSSAPS